MHNYQDTTDDVVHTYGRVHGNGEQTHVHVVSCGGESYAAVAFDVNPAEFEPVAAECVAYDPTLEGAVQRAQRWMERNPKGVAYQDGDEDDGGGSKALAILKRLARNVNEYGNQQVDDIQQHGGNK